MDWNERFQEAKELWNNNQYEGARNLFNEVAEATMDPAAIEMAMLTETVVAGMLNNGITSGFPFQNDCKESAERALRWIAEAEKDSGLMAESGEKIKDYKRVCTYLKGKMMYLLGDNQCEFVLKDAATLGHNQARLFLGLFYKDKAEKLINASDKALLDQIYFCYKQMSDWFEQFIDNYNPDEADQDELVMASGLVASAYRDGVGVEKNSTKADYYEAIVDSFDPATKSSNPEKYLAQKKANQTTSNNAPQNNGGCYIATSVYGSYDCPEVWTLRRYRDQTLSKSMPGKAFIKIYYGISPTVVKLFGKTRWFNGIWRLILDKKVKKFNSRGYNNSPYKDM